jgi:hypothetical protein
MHAQILISLLLGDKLNSGKIEFGLDGGMNWADLKNLEPSKSKRAFNLGFYFDIKLFKDPAWMLNTGVIVKSTMGDAGLPVYALGDRALDSAFMGGRVIRKVNYFNVPVMMKYNFKNHIFLKAGIMLGLRYKAYDEFIKDVNEDEDLNYKIKIKDDFHPLDAGLAFGAGYHFMKGNGMNLGLSYYLGLIDVVIDDVSPNQYNRSFYITLGIPIGKGKAAKKKKEDQLKK